MLSLLRDTNWQNHGHLECHRFLWQWRTTKQEAISSSLPFPQPSGMATLNIRRVGKCNSALCSEGRELQIRVSSTKVHRQAGDH